MPDASAVRTWFDHKGFGESNARQMTATFLMIASGKPPEAPAEPSATKDKPAKKKAAAQKTAAKRVPSHDPVVNPPAPPAPPSAPNVHLDIQIHIPSESSPEQIDQIFASMAKHLYGR